MTSSKVIMAAQMKISGVLTFLYVLLVSVSADGRVPVIAWSNGKLLSSLESVPAGHTVSPNDLQNNYLDAIIKNGPQSIVLLLQDKLSMEDFTLYGDVYSKDHSKNTFHHLKDSLDSSSSSLTLPAVNYGDESGLVHYLSSRIDGSVQKLNSPTPVKDMKLDNTKTNVIIYHLKTPDSDDKTKVEKLSDLDNYLGDVSKTFHSQGTPYTMLLTATEPSNTLDTESHKTLQRVRRQDVEAADVKNSTYQFLNTSCIYFFAKKMVFTLNVTGDNEIHAAIDLTGHEPDTTVDCSDQNRTLTAVYKYSEDEVTLDMTMNMVFSHDKTMWYTDEFTLDYSYKNGSESKTGKDEQLQCRHISAPLKRSYHCDNPPDDNIKGENGTAYIDFTKLQVQPYNITESGFSDADDCIGFFTPAVWMSLLAILLMTLVLAFGLAFLLSLSTMDRFDDPKGKQLVITTDD